MEPDFYHQYQDLTVHELVKVARTPDDYLPEAVAAAERILRERGISREEIGVEEWLIAQKEMADGLRKERRFGWRAWVQDLFGRNRFGSPEERWYGGFLICFCLFYVYQMYRLISELSWLSDCKYCPPKYGTLIAMDLFFVAYATVCLYFILRQAWLGWSLLVVYLVHNLARAAGRLYFFFAHHRFPLFLYSLYVIPAIIFIGLGLFLWQPQVMGTFKVKAAIRNRTLLVAAFAGLAGLLLS